ncbi:MAG TPA: hypothetical protein VF721_11645 [Pyrinomonadaceae bacterium]
MKRLSLGTYTLFLAIIFWAVLLGGIVYSHLVYFPVYLSDLPGSAVVVTGKYGLREARFWMTIHPLLILSLIGAVVLNWKLKARRKLILLSFAAYIVVLTVSFLYFVPELMAFERSAESNLTAAEWLARGNRWQYLSWMRGAVCFIFFVPLLVALTKSDADDGV